MLPEINLAGVVAARGGDVLHMHKRRRRIYARLGAFLQARFWKTVSDLYHRLGLGRADRTQD